MKRPHLLIVGCGDIGCRVAPLLLAQGWLVSGLSRSPDRLPDSLSHCVQGDYTKPDSLSAASELGADYLLFTPTPTAFDQAGYQQGYAEGARSIGSVLAPQIRHIMAVSSTRVYAERRLWHLKTRMLPRCCRPRTNSGAQPRPPSFDLAVCTTVPIQPGFEK